MTFSVPVDADAYPSSQYSFELVLRGPQKILIESTEAADQSLLVASHAETADWAPGRYLFSVRAISNDGSEKHEMLTGSVSVVGDIADGDEPIDGRGHAEKVLAAIEAVIEKRATRDQEEYQINNRSLKRTPIADLLALRDKYIREISAKRRKGFGRYHRVRF